MSKMALPILWRYLLSRYFSTLFLSVGTFIAILLVARFKEMARFASLSADWGKTALFTLYQIPHILPIALPISALLASFLLFQTLSRTFELTAMRASSASLFTLSAPICIASCFLSFFNFSFSAEIAPFCRRNAKKLLYDNTSLNPLLLLQRQKFMKLKRAYLRFSVVEEGKRGKDLLLILPNQSHNTLTLLSAEQIDVEGDQFIAKNLASVSHLPKKREGFHPLVIENQKKMSTSAFFLSKLLKKSAPKLEAAALSFRDLQFRKKEGGQKANTAKIEMSRRILLAFSVLSFTLLGISFGIEPPRQMSKRNHFIVLFFSLTALLGYFLGKELKTHLLWSFFSLFFPQVLLWIASGYQLYRIRRGF